MIALNELLENIEEYRQIYNKFGLKVDLDKIVDLEKNRKQIQLDFEQNRAKCNKLCSEIATLRMNNQDTFGAMDEILLLDATIKAQDKKLNKLGNNINRKLKKLRNIPHEFVQNDMVISENNKAITLEEFLKFLKENFTVQEYKVSLQNYLKQQRNKLFNEEELPCLTLCKNGILCLDTNFNIENLLKVLIDYFSKRSFIIKKINSKSTSKTSADEFVIKLFDYKIKLQTIYEFKTREFNIKYKNKSADMTKFVNQINIKY